MRDLARYWASEYDWRQCETWLNAVPNFVTEIDGLDIHFIHGVIQLELFSASFIGTPAPSGLSDEELSTYEQPAGDPPTRPSRASR